jgi:flagellar hook assembly protein FlgD
VTFRVDLASPDASSPVRLTIVDLQGRRIRTLDGALSVGIATLVWDGRGDSGEVLASGVYGWTLDVENNTGSSTANASGTLMIVR